MAPGDRDTPRGHRRPPRFVLDVSAAVVPAESFFLYSVRWPVTWCCRCVKGSMCRNVSVFLPFTYPSCASLPLPWLSFSLVCVSSSFLSFLRTFFFIPFHNRIADLYVRALLLPLTNFGVLRSDTQHSGS